MAETATTLAAPQDDASFLDKYKPTETSFLDKYAAYKPMTGADPANEQAMLAQTLHNKPSDSPTVRGLADDEAVKRDPRLKPQPGSPQYPTGADADAWRKAHNVSGTGPITPSDVAESQNDYNEGKQLVIATALPSAYAHPIAAAGSVAGSIAGGKGSRAVAKNWFHASPDNQDIAEDAGGIIGGVAGGFGAPKLVDAAVESPFMKQVATTPIRVGARAAEHSVNEYLAPVRSVLGTQLPADESAGMRFKMPGRDFGLPKPGVVSKDPFALTPEAGETEPAVQSPFNFPKHPPTVSTSPFELKPPPTESEAPVQNHLGFPKGQPTVSSAPFALTAPHVAPEAPVQNELFPRQPKGELFEETRYGTPPPDEEGSAGLVGAPTHPQPQSPTGFRTGSPPLSKETHPFIPPPQVTGAKGVNYDIQTSENPLLRSTEENPANVTHAGNPDELEAAFTRQQRHINGDKVMDAVGQDRDLAKQVRDIVGMSNPKNPEAPSLQRAIKNLTGENWVISSSQRLGGAASSRIDGFNYLIGKGYSPAQIVEAAARQK